MNDLYYYLIFGVVLYFLFTRAIEKYSNLKQENFDPSLVPVSSIVTLAKVAQKLVNGNGTLTNPGNLQIGASTGAPGNLTVMGGTIINGANAPSGVSLNVTGPTTIDGAITTGTSSGTNYIKGTTNMNAVNANSISVTGNTTVGNNLIINGNGSNSIQINARDNSGISQIVSDTAATGIRFYSNKGGKYTLESNSDGKLFVHGDAAIDSTLGVTGNTTMDGILTLKGASNSSNGQINDKDGVSRLLFWDPDKNTYYDSGSGNVHHFRGYKGAEGTNVNVHGNLTVSGRNILAELNRLNNYVNGTNPLRLRRVGNDGNEGAYFKGDGWVGTGDGWSPWRIYGTV